MESLAMSNFFDDVIKNIEKLFSELFHLLEQYEGIVTSRSILTYSFNELSMINLHVDNVVGFLLQELHEIAYFLNVATPNHNINPQDNQIEHLIATIHHLTGSLPNKKINKISPVKNSNVSIYIREIDSHLIFYIYEKLNCVTSGTYSSLKSILNTEDIFIEKNIGISALHDVISFERLFYSVITSSIVNKICENLHKSEDVAISKR